MWLHKVYYLQSQAAHMIIPWGPIKMIRVHLGLEGSTFIFFSLCFYSLSFFVLWDFSPTSDFVVKSQISHFISFLSSSAFFSLKIILLVALISSSDS